MDHVMILKGNESPCCFMDGKYHLNFPGWDPEFLDKYVNTVLGDTMASFVADSPEGSVLNMHVLHVLVVIERDFKNDVCHFHFKELRQMDIHNYVFRTPPHKQSI